MRGSPASRRLIAAAWALALGATSLACRETFQLVPAEGGAGGSGGSFGDGGQVNNACQTIAATPRLPELVIALDHSMAMTPQFGNFASRLAAAQAQVFETVSHFQSFVWFGYVEFPATDNSCAGSGCCAGSVVPPGPGVGILSALQACTSAPGGCIATNWRPMSDALGQIGKTLGPNVAGHRRYVLAITGDDPNCGDTPCSDAANAAFNLLIYQG